MSRTDPVVVHEVIAPKELLWTLDLSDLAYLSEFALKTSSCYIPEEHGVLVASLFGNANKKCTADTQAHIFYRIQTSTVYIAFRGSQDLPTFFKDDDTEKLVTMGGQHGKACVHEGFLHQYKSIQKELLHVLLNKVKFETIVFCGHSIGGALAVIAAAYYLNSPQRHTKQVKIHTFGAPRIGNKAFSDYFNQQQNFDYWRVNSDYDPIPRVPASPKFCHIANCHVFNLFEFNSTTTTGDNNVNEPHGAIANNLVNHNLRTFYGPRLERELTALRPGNRERDCRFDCLIM